MKYNPKNHHRKSIRLKEYDYTNPGWYYITICTYKHHCIFGNIKNGKVILNEYGKIAQEEWLNTKFIRKNIDLDYFVIMPNHFHGIIIIDYFAGATRWVALTDEKPTLRANSFGVVIGQFKSKVTKRIRKEGRSNFKWQRNYYEHIIRNDIDLYRIRKYIELNPFKWELDDYYKLKGCSTKLTYDNRFDSYQKLFHFPSTINRN